MHTQTYHPIGSHMGRSLDVRLAGGGQGHVRIYLPPENTRAHHTQGAEFSAFRKPEHDPKLGNQLLSRSKRERNLAGHPGRVTPVNLILQIRQVHVDITQLRFISV